MKKTKILSLVLVLAISIFCFAACGEEENVASHGKAKIVIESRDGSYAVYEVILEELSDRSKGAVSLLESLAIGEIEWGGGYGAYINNIGNLNPDPASEYVSIYTSESRDFAVPTASMQTVPSINCEGKTLSYAGVGLSAMHINDGTVILFRVEKF